MIDELFDDNGRLIISTGDEKIKKEKEFELEVTLAVAFAELNDTERLLTQSNMWEMSEDNAGLVFIFTDNADVIYNRVLIKNIDTEEIVWQSEIIEVPENTVSLQGYGETAKYMSARAINKDNMPKGDDVYKVQIENYEDSFLILNVKDIIFANEENETYGIKEDSFQDIELDEIILPDCGVEEEHQFETVVYDVDCKEKVFNEFLKDNNLDETELLDEAIIEDSEKNEYLMVSQELGENQYGEIEQINQVEIADEDIIIEDKIAYIVNKLIQYSNISLSIGEFSNEKNNLDSNIIIEKLADQYIVTINKLAFKPILLLDDEKPYFEFKYGVESFYDKVKSIVCNMYRLDIEEFNKLKKIIVLDKIQAVNIQDEENLEVLMKSDIISLINRNGENTISITKNGIKIYLVDENNRKLEIEYSSKDILNDKKLIESIYELPKVLNEKFLIFNECEQNGTIESICEKLI